MTNSASCLEIAVQIIGKGEAIFLSSFVNKIGCGHVSDWAFRLSFNSLMRS